MSPLRLDYSPTKSRILMFIAKIKKETILNYVTTPCCKSIICLHANGPLQTVNIISTTIIFPNTISTLITLLLVATLRFGWSRLRVWPHPLGFCGWLFGSDAAHFGSKLLLFLPSDTDITCGFIHEVLQNTRRSFLKNVMGGAAEWKCEVLSETGALRCWMVI